MDGDQLGSSPPLSASFNGVSGVPSPQFAILNYFFPGFPIFSSAANAYFETDINTFLPVLLAIGGFVVWNQARESFWSLVDDYLMSSVCIRTDDEVYNMVMLWLSKQGFSRNSRHFLANTDITSRHRYMYRYTDSDADSDSVADDDNGGVKGATSRKKKALHYTPAFGSQFFWYKGHPLFFERRKDREQLNMQTTSEREELSLWCFGRNPRILKELLLDARQLNMNKDERKTLIYRGNLNETYWQRCMSRLNRPFSTVILHERIKRELLEDVADYLDPGTRRFYANRGLSYRRGYLLHGPPGTGKSSLSLALAGYFRMKIYVVSLSSAAATDENITALFHELPTYCIVLLEDIDSAGLTHTRDDASVSGSSQVTPVSSSAEPASRPAPSVPGPPVAGGRLSLSGLLNILDGVASQEGRILIMTTNHIEKLDKALIRPGRIDMIIPFGLADAETTSAIFRAIYAPYDNETVRSRRLVSSDKAGGVGTSSSSTVSDDSEAEEERAAIRVRVEGLARRFAAEIPEGRVQPCRSPRSPPAAQAQPGRSHRRGRREWVAKMRRERNEQMQTKKAPHAQSSAEKSGSGTSDSEQEERENQHRTGDGKDCKNSIEQEGVKSEAEFQVKVTDASRLCTASA